MCINTFAGGTFTSIGAIFGDSTEKLVIKVFRFFEFKVFFRTFQQFLSFQRSYFLHINGKKIANAIFDLNKGNALKVH